MIDGNCQIGKATQLHNLQKTAVRQDRGRQVRFARWLALELYMAPLVVFAVVVVLLVVLFLCLATQTSFVKSLLFSVAISHLLASLTILVLMEFAVGFGKLNIIDTYVELDQRGVIDHAKLREVRGGRFAEYWACLTILAITLMRQNT